MDMDIADWILLALGGFCFALVFFIWRLGEPSRHLKKAVKARKPKA
jgi:hypothetical protein